MVRAAPGQAGSWAAFHPEVDPEAAAERLEGVVEETPLRPFPSGDRCIELRLKLECLQVTRSFKARGAWNQVSQLTADQRRAGVVAVSSGNHAQAVAWAAERAGVPVRLFMPEDAYPNKIQACRDLGAEVVLLPTRAAAEAACADAAAAGPVLVHPYAARRTLEGAGTVGVEIARQWPEAEAVVFPVGGGGLISGSSLALRRAWERAGAGRAPVEPRWILGAEPEGAAGLFLALAAGCPVALPHIDSGVQGLCPPGTGEINLALCSETVDRVMLLADDEILAAQRRLVRKGGLAVEPAGAAAAAVVLGGGLPGECLAGSSRRRPLRVVAVVSGGNPDPVQLAELLG